MSTYTNDIDAVATLRDTQGSAWNAINPEYAARMRAQNKFKTGLDIAKYTAAIMRKDMERYDNDTSQYTQSLGCWHGFVGQQKLIFIKKLADREAPLQVLWFNNLLGVAIASLAVIPVWQMPSPEQWGALIGLGVMMAGAQACFVNGMARADASFAAPFSYSTLIFASGYDFLVFRQLPDFVTVLGAGIILSGAALLAWREGRPRVKTPDKRAA